MTDALSRTIHDLVRFVDDHPENLEARSELARLKHERRVAIESLVEGQAVELSRLVSEQVDSEDSPLSLSAQYRGACALYQAIMNLVVRNRSLKARLREEMKKNKQVNL
ncbi:hypothetical protein GOV10_05340 [Candidatus Woesearchaeota archaeon]|nr:hypothetical protein [Candidatus Woesearchaeota archaeon]